MAVEHDVVPFAPAEALHLLDERVEVLGERGPRKGGRARRDVDDASPHPRGDDLRDRGVLAAGEDVHLEADPAQLPGQLADVDVHPARLLAAERGQRAGVQREQRDAAHATVTRKTSVGTAPKPYLYGSSPRRKS